jgi:phosphoglucomutase
VTDYTFFKAVDLSKVGEYKFTKVERPGKPEFVIKVVENVEFYVDLMKKHFDFGLIQKMFNRNDFKMIFDSMYGAAGPYAKAIFGR